MPYIYQVALTINSLPCWRRMDHHNRLWMTSCRSLLPFCLDLGGFQRASVYRCPGRSRGLCGAKLLPSAVSALLPLYPLE